MWKIRAQRSQLVHVCSHSLFQTDLMFNPFNTFFFTVPSFLISVSSDLKETVDLSDVL